MCRNTPRCGFYAAPNHATIDCIVKEDSSKHRCAPCRSLAAQHAAWDYNCPVRTRHTELAKLAYSTRATLFQERTATTATATLANLANLAASTTTTLAASTTATLAASTTETLAALRTARAATEPLAPRTTTYKRP